MNLFGWELSLSRKSAVTLSIDEVIRRLNEVYETYSGVVVTPESCMESPTVQAIVNGISRTMATLPIRVQQKTAGSNGRTVKQDLPNHPVARLVQKPNGWQPKEAYWQDAFSRYLRHGNFFAHKGRGKTGPIRELIPMDVGSTDVKQDPNYDVFFTDGTGRRYERGEVHHVRMAARDGLRGNSPVTDAREAIALEIAAQRMGATFFGNGALPLLAFKFAEATQEFKTDEEKKEFLRAVQAALGNRKRWSPFFLPKGIEMADPIKIENDHAQFLDTRKYQRTVIAAAWGMTPDTVGDFERATFNNAEQYAINRVVSVLLPNAKIFEGAMEFDLLTPEDRSTGVIIRFNLDGLLRGDFKARQDGLKVQRESGVICSNEWREVEGLNPISDKDGGEEFWRQGPSGQSASPGGNKPNASNPNN